jgi:hypothetical protein
LIENLLSDRIAIREGQKGVDGCMWNIQLQSSLLLIIGQRIIVGSQVDLCKEGIQKVDLALAIMKTLSAFIFVRVRFITKQGLRLY